MKRDGCRGFGLTSPKGSFELVSLYIIQMISTYFIIVYKICNTN